MPAEPFQAPPAQRLLIAGATGALGNEVLRQLVGQQRFASTHVLAREPIRAGLRGVHVHVVDGHEPSAWPALPGDTAVVMFDPPRLFHDRERALWTPAPEQLPELARWLRAGGVRTLAVVLPHAQMRLPDALKRGLASLDEQAIAGLGFDRLLIVRSARKAEAARASSVPAAIANWMLSVLKYMIPSSEQPLRAVKVAQFVAIALQLAPAGIHVAATDTVWHAAQHVDMRAAVARWLAA